MNKLLPALFLLLFSPVIVAQNRGFTEYRYPQRINIIEGSPASPNTDPLIRRLAEGNNKSPRSTAFTLEFECLLRVFTREPSYVYQVETSHLRLRGDINYKGFDVSDYLLPSDMQFKLRLEKPNGQFMEVPFNCLVAEGKPETLSYNDNDTIGYQFTRYRLENFVFRYSNNNLFENHIRLINEYYTFLDELDRGYQLLQTVNPAFEDNFRNNQRNLLEAEQILARVEQRQIDRDLPLQHNDPGRYIEKLRIYRVNVMNRRQELNIVFSTLHLQFYDKAMYHYRRENLVRAREFLVWALEVNPLFTPALLQWAIIDFRQGDLHEAGCKADDILFNMPADPETKDRTLDLLGDIHNEYLRRGENQLSRSAFRKALDEFESAGKLCSRHPALRCEGSAKEGIRKAKGGIYKQFLETARKNVAAGELDRAEDAAEEAIRYQSRNPEIRDLTEAQNVLTAIRQKRYDNTVSRARSLTEQKQYEAALRQIQISDSMLVQFSLRRTDDYGQLLNAAVRPRILELLYEGEIYVENNNLNQARKRYRSASDLRQKYNFTNDADINKHLESLRKNIFNQQCINAQASIDSAFNTGNMQAAQGYYLSADDTYQYAIRLAKENADCDISTDSIEQEAFNIRPAVTFYTFLEQSDLDMKSGSYQSSIDNFLSAGKYFTDMQVNRFGIEFNPDLFTYIRERGNAGLINYSGDYYRERGELDKSLAQYKLLLSRNYDSRLMAGSLYQLGLSLGDRDRKKYAGAKWKDLVTDYTGGDKRLKRLAKGYKAGFAH